MTTILIVLIVISLALDVLILASLGNLITLFGKPRNRPAPIIVEIDAHNGVSSEALQEAVRKAVSPRYDA